MDQLRIAIHGAAGRMGKRLVALALSDPELDLVAAVDAATHPSLGQDAGTLAGVEPAGIPVSAELPDGVQALVDFSMPAGAERATRQCRERGIPLVMATTGLSEEQEQGIRDAASEIPIVWAPNMSMAVNLTMKLAALAARTLKSADADVEIMERHHRFKEDAPSGTALRFGQIIAEEMGMTKHQHGREGRPGTRPRDEIGYHALRVADNPGEHTMVFAIMGETIELTVRASNRDCYASGALTAAKFAAQQSPGIYDMFAVLGLT